MPRPLFIHVLMLGTLSCTFLFPLHAATDFPTTRDIPFATVGDHTIRLDLYPPSGDIVGLIVWVHGGAWHAGSRASVDLKSMTDFGWTVASVDYRLSRESRFPAQVHDIKAAIRYLRAHAAELQVPAYPIVIGGSSAGGHLAALVGVSNKSPVLEGNVGADLDSDSSVQAIIALYGASNLLTILAQSTPHGLKVRQPALDLFIGGQPADVPEMAKLASPMYHIDASDPLLYVSHGDQDPRCRSTKPMKFRALTPNSASLTSSMSNTAVPTADPPSPTPLRGSGSTSSSANPSIYPHSPSLALHPQNSGQQFVTYDVTNRPRESPPSRHLFI
ncbi:MAG: alpha/beta hydrolase [Candidatus Synoicihabitans palmerolidicus]|nr:alpha/beta hydrolase [Candidatus Synoicihabitans palmerolidicus]